MVDSDVDISHVQADDHVDTQTGDVTSVGFDVRDLDAPAHDAVKNIKDATRVGPDYDRRRTSIDDMELAKNLTVLSVDQDVHNLNTSADEDRAGETKHGNRYVWDGQCRQSYSRQLLQWTMMWMREMKSASGDDSAVHARVCCVCGR